MADQTSFAIGVPRKLVDMGDGTYAEQVVVGGALLTAAQSTDPVQVYNSNSYVRLLDSAAAIKSGTGTFFGLTVGAPGTTISVTVYDSLTASGTILYGPVVLPAAGTAINMPGGGLAFGTGLSIGFSATTGTPNIVAAYR